MTESNSEDSDSREMKGAVSISAACAGLRHSAFRATHNLASATPSDLSSVVRQQLRRLCHRSGSTDAHLFRIQLKDSESGFLGIRYHAGLTATDRDLTMLGRFQFHLLPENVRHCLLNEQIAVIRQGSTGGGRLITGLLKQVKCASYLLCPLLIDGRLLGILGVARTDSDDVSGHHEFLELLKLNGAILLSHVIRVRREKMRRRKLSRWRRIADHACDFAFSVDAGGTIFGTTPFGMSEITPQLNGLRLTDVVDRSFHRQIQNEIRAAAQAEKVRTFVFQLTLGHQGPVWYLARIEPSGTTPNAYATLYLTDNSPDKVLQEENRELTEKLVRASRLGLLGQMSTEFAHQLNQPLQAILNYCNIMQRRLARETATTENQLKALSNIEKSVMHSADIIQRIREFVKFRSLRIDNVTVAQLLDQAIMMVMPTARARNADLITPVDDMDISVSVDKTQTTHVLVNIIINALEACTESTSRRPRIEVSVKIESNENRVIIAVSDNGPGLPKNDPAIVFRKFYSGKEEGLGMGLSISREVCETQGGQLTAENNSDEVGCTFLVTLPLAAGPDSDTAELPIISATEPPID